MNARALPTLRAVFTGYAPRVLQARGWVLAGLAMAPVLLSLVVRALASHALASDPRLALQIFHNVLVGLVLPIMVLVAAPGGIREDIEQRTLPLVLVRPVPAWILPLAKGLLWYAWGALWLSFSGLGLTALGADPASAAQQAFALVLAYWAELAFLNLLILVFSRGTLWGAIVLFGWENLLRVLPATLQRFTFLHHIESISGSRGGLVADYEVLAQAQITSPVPVSVLVLLLVGALAWALAGWRLHRTPIGLAGREAEG
ncbi:hypothetical protein [Mesoterricola sediminis]|uniref:Uncharacterized protein n=1 Tax=Mesoterricola sediminis TaxID=2927980 RepID=A0AA48KAL3_9BACT|nr:hypothetical protein [Mesoterricola sediminis]BDU75184.1 hypothetical protein METESE_01420 [Mesoterricola sediminis]